MSFRSVAAALAVLVASVASAATPATDFTLRDLDGAEVRLEDYKGKVVFVDFWATWCGPCRMVAPEVKKAAHNLAGTALVLKVDTDAQPELAQRYQVSSIPNFAVFSGGRLLRQQPGAVDHRQLEKLAVAPQ